MPEQKRTYLPYVRGIDPKRLRIGNLVLDPYNPTTGIETGRVKYKGNATQEEYWKSIEPWAGEPQLDSPCVLKFVASHDWSIEAGIIELIHGDVSRQAQNHATIEGRVGRRFEIEEPLRFFKEEVFKQEGVRDWIQKQVSISFGARLKKWSKSKDVSWRAPEIWLCTGIQLISGGYVRAGSSAGASQGAGVTLDPGMIHGIPTGQSVADIDISHSTSNTANNSYGHADERVWAAQFYRLDVEFGKPSSEDHRAGHSPTGMNKILEKPLIIDLREIEDLGASAVRDEAEDTDEDSDDGDVSRSKIAEIIGLESLSSVTNGQDTTDTRTDTININDKSYAKALGDVDWRMYEKYSRYWDKLVSYDKQSKTGK